MPPLETRTDRDHGELRAARDLNHVEIAVAVSGIEGFHRHHDQEVVLALVADSLATRRVAHAIGLM